MYSKKYLLLVLTSLIFLPTITWANSPQQLNLSEAILLALRYSPFVQNAEIQRVVDKFNLQLAKNAYEVNYALEGAANYNNNIQSNDRSESNGASLTPSATLNRTPYGTSFQLSEVNTINHTAGGSYYYNPGINLKVTQPLLRGFGKDINMIPLYNAKDRELINQLNLKNTLISTITQVINQYMLLVQAENTLKTQQISLQNSIATRDRYQALIKAGRNAPADLIQFQASVASQQLTLEQQQLGVQQTKLVLLNILGLDPNTTFVIATNASLPTLSLPSLNASIELALHSNTNYQTQLINFRILQRDYVTAKDQQRWQLNLTAQTGVGGASGGSPNAGLASLSNGANVNNQVGLQLAIPIDNLNLKQQTVQAKNTLEQAKISLAAAKRQVISDVTTAYNNLLSQKQQIKQAQEAIRLANDNLQIAYTKARYGRISAFEVSSLQSALTNTQIALINTEENYNSTIANFDQTIGITLQRWHVQIRD